MSAALDLKFDLDIIVALCGVDARKHKPRAMGHWLIVDIPVTHQRFG